MANVLPQTASPEELRAAVDELDRQVEACERRAAETLQLARLLAAKACRLRAILQERQRAAEQALPAAP